MTDILNKRDGAEKATSRTDIYDDLSIESEGRSGPMYMQLISGVDSELVVNLVLAKNQMFLGFCPDPIEIEKALREPREGAVIMVANIVESNYDKYIPGHVAYFRIRNGKIYLNTEPE